MGISYSSGNSSSNRASVKNDFSFANVVSLSGEWRQYPLPIQASQILDSQPDVFLCNSDSLAFDEFIPKLGSAEFLQPAQIYFVLPVSKLNSRLTGPDMAALAVKASAGIQSYGKNARRGKSKARISPVVVVAEEVHHHRQPPVLQPMSSTPGLQASGSGSARKLQRFSSKRAKMVVRSFKLRLNTIYEGSVLVSS
ncbi:OLC1v1024813C1 [Oldenlandia corymbosa var. corymbosa]|uniref:OLC1v1024813C1 n=1 Tax=Oldenlandia corymbosa var. corymbosa TaxID=529605 RepID=A0AAV1C3D7_OLDCO|nr:OLC1v1024813C1 [Oldenlandia corymbosa var. corymbosa]